MEELLNNLIEKGWKPFGNKKIKDAKTARWNKNLLDEEVNKVSKFKDKVAFTNWVLIFDEINLRELVSKESWLWQFVCENGMINVPHPNKWKYPRDKLEREQYKYWDRTIWYYWEDNLDRMWYSWDKYQFRLIEASLKDESELENFILDNIIIKWTK